MVTEVKAYYGHLLGLRFNVYSRESRQDVLGRFNDQSPVSGPIRDKRGQIIAEVVELVLNEDGSAKVRPGVTTSSHYNPNAVDNNAIDIQTTVSLPRAQQLYDQAVLIINADEKWSAA
jgi:hypothetical protein